MKSNTWLGSVTEMGEISQTMQIHTRRISNTMKWKQIILLATVATLLSILVSSTCTTESVFVYFQIPDKTTSSSHSKSGNTTGNSTSLDNSSETTGTNSNITTSMTAEPSFSVTNVFASDYQTVIIKFNKEFPPGYVIPAGSFSVSGGLMILSTEVDGTNADQINLNTTEQQAIEYTLMITNLDDGQGNTIDEEAITFQGIAWEFCITQVDAVSPYDKIEVRFNANVDPTSGSTVSNWSVPQNQPDPNNISITGASVHGSYADRIVLTLDKIIPEDTTYAIAVTSITDTEGNPVCTDESFTVSRTGVETSFYIYTVTPTDSNTIVLDFNINVDPTTGENPSNYSIPGLVITGVSLDGGDPSNVIITTDNQVPSQEYELTVTPDIQSSASDPYNGSTSFTFYGYVT